MSWTRTTGQWSMPKRIIVGISGSSGPILGIRLLEELKGLGYETHLIISETAEKILEHETDRTVEDVKSLASHVHGNKDFFAPISSGSFKTDGMVVVPCSMKTLAGIASGYSDNLLLRAADVCLKERRRLVLVTRETPLSGIHIENMLRVTRAGGTILPPVISLYNRPQSIEEMVDHILGKVLDALDIENDVYERWGSGADG